MSIDDFLNLGDNLFQNGRYEEKSLAISFMKSQRPNYTKDIFQRIGFWFDYGVDNWATTDIPCMLVLSSFLIDNIIGFGELKEWNSAQSEWQRRAVPVTLVELTRKDLKPTEAIHVVEPLMNDESQYVQKAENPEGMLYDFLSSTYEAAANSANWDSH